MANIDDVRGGLAQAVAKLREAAQTFQQGKSNIEEARTFATTSLQGSVQSEAEQINAHLSQLLESVDQIAREADTAASTVEGFGQRL